MSNSASSDSIPRSELPLTEQEQRTQVRAFLALPREFRARVPLSAFLDIMRTWLRTRALGTPKSLADLDTIRAHWNDMSVDDVYNKAMATAALEIYKLRDGLVTTLTQFTATVVAYMLDRESYPETWPLDRKALDAETRETLARFNPPYMYKGREYSAEECRKIHAEMSEAEIQDQIVKTCAAFKKILKKLSPGSVAEIKKVAREYVEEEFTIGDAIRRYVRTQAAG